MLLIKGFLQEGAALDVPERFCRILGWCIRGFANMVDRKIQKKKTSKIIKTIYLTGCYNARLRTFGKG